MDQITREIKKIKELYLDGALAQRALSIHMEPFECGYDIVAWQCNMASMKTTDLKLPTVLHIELDAEGVVTKANLLDGFKGSQGIPCSRKYLDRILSEKLMGISYESDDHIFRNELMFHCRHIFEVVAATISFYRYCKECLNERNSMWELTQAFESECGICVKEKYVVNNAEVEVEEKLVFESEGLTMQIDGKISDIRKMQFVVEGKLNKNPILNLSEEIEDIHGSDKVAMSVMKMFSRPWKQLGARFGFRRNYYFTNLVPSSLYGVVVQAVALLIFPNNYNYFQHSLAGLQRADNRPLCVGMVLNKGELSKFFPEFTQEDLFD